MYSPITRAIQRHYGHRPVRRTCAKCGLDQPNLSSFPASNLLGVSALVWATRDRPPLWGASLHCPECGAPMPVPDFPTA